MSTNISRTAEMLLGIDSDYKSTNRKMNTEMDIIVSNIDKINETYINKVEMLYKIISRLQVENKELKEQIEKSNS